MVIPWGPSPAMNATNVHYRVGDVNVGITLIGTVAANPTS